MGKFFNGWMDDTLSVEQTRKLDAKIVGEGLFFSLSCASFAARLGRACPLPPSLHVQIRPSESLVDRLSPFPLQSFTWVPASSSSPSIAKPLRVSATLYPSYLFPLRVGQSRSTLL